jgi:hypothetical protein
MNQRKLIVALFSMALLFSNAAESSGATTLNISESANGKTFRVDPGSTIKVTLNSTFWNFQSANNLSGNQLPTMTAIMPGPTAPSNCQLPGMGCGTVVWKFKAGKSGSASFVATRTSCGEALRCTAKQSKYSVIFRIK